MGGVPEVCAFLQVFLRDSFTRSSALPTDDNLPGSRDASITKHLADFVFKWEVQTEEYSIIQ